MTMTEIARRFRPLYGVSLFLRGFEEVRGSRRVVFVPSTGYLYFYLAEKKFKQKGIAFSSPLRGISISTLFVIII